MLKRITLRKDKFIKGVTIFSPFKRIYDNNERKVEHSEGASFTLEIKDVTVSLAVTYENCIHSQFFVPFVYKHGTSIPRAQRHPRDVAAADVSVSSSALDYRVRCFHEPWKFSSKILTDKKQRRHFRDAAGLSLIL